MYVCMYVFAYIHCLLLVVYITSSGCQESRLLSCYAHCDEVYLTFVGGTFCIGFVYIGGQHICMYVCMYVGGVFGNRRDWIGRAIGRAVATAEKQTNRGGRLGRHIKVSIYTYEGGLMYVCALVHIST